MNKIKSTSFTVLSLICMTIPGVMMGLWIYVFGLSNVQSKRVELYNSYLPQFMENTTVSTLVSIAFCIAAIFFSIAYFQSSKSFTKGIKIAVIVISSGILLLNIFSLL